MAFYKTENELLFLVGGKNEKINIPNLEDIKIENEYLVDDLLKDLPLLKAGEGDGQIFKIQNTNNRGTSNLTPYEMELTF